MRRITLPAKLDYLCEANTFICGFARENGFNSDKEQNHIELVTEEVFANIVAYAYPDSEGKVEIGCQIETDSLVIEFLDAGIAYNPLETPDPDIDLPVKLRPIGGLGIYFVKHYMDSVGYERKKDKNILTLKNKRRIAYESVYRKI